MKNNKENSDIVEHKHDSNHDIETYRHAIEEARRTLDQQLQAFNDVADKGWRIVQLNGIIATVYASAVVNALNILDFSILTVGSILFGFLLMGISIFIVVSEQEGSKISIGQSPEAFESMRKNDPEEFEYLREVIKEYESSIKSVGEKTEYNSRIVTGAKILLTAGVGFLVSGTLLSIV